MPHRAGSRAGARRVRRGTGARSKRTDLVTGRPVVMTRRRGRRGTI